MKRVQKTMSCKDCKYLAYGLDPWDPENIRITCEHLGSEAIIKAPAGWDETGALPSKAACELDLGMNNSYCYVNEKC